MKTLAAVVWLVVAVAYSAAQRAPADWHDDLVEHMAGTWILEGQVMGRPAHHDLVAEWVLNHQFLSLHEKTSADAPAAERRYEALWFVGYDGVSERYVMHLLDIFGARYAETLGYGTRDGNTVRFVYEYPEGPFHSTYQWSPRDDTWQWLLEEKNKEGKWVTFADLKLTRAAKP